MTKEMLALLKRLLAVGDLVLRDAAGGDSFGDNGDVPSLYQKIYVVVDDKPDDSGQGKPHDAHKDR
jgi:hypothetical protein